MKPPKLALMLAEPTPAPVTSPDATVATLESVVFQMAEPVTSLELPSAKFAVALSVTVPPGEIVAEVGDTEIPVMGELATTTVVLPVTPENVALMPEVPPLSAVP